MSEGGESNWWVAHDVIRFEMSDARELDNCTIEERDRTNKGSNEDLQMMISWHAINQDIRPSCAKAHFNIAFCNHLSRQGLCARPQTSGTFTYYLFWSKELILSLRAAVNDQRQSFWSQWLAGAAGRWLMLWCCHVRLLDGSVATICFPGPIKDRPEISFSLR